MKKTRRVLPYLMVLALIMSLFTGMVGKTVQVKADPSFKVLEIVPDESMAMFKYYALSTPTDEMLLNWQGNQWLKKYLDENNIVEDKVSGSTHTYVSKDYFRQQILVPAGYSASTNVIVKTRTAATCKVEDVAEADFIVINSSVPIYYTVDNNNQQHVNYNGKQYRFGYDVLSGLTYYDNPRPRFKTNETIEVDGKNVEVKYDFDWDVVYAIFKKVAGVDSDPIPYMIDYNMFLSLKNYGTGINLNNGFYGTGTNENWIDYLGSNKKFSYLSADQLDDVAESAQVSEGAKDEPGRYGSNTNTFKLYSLLASMNPASLYGIYCASHDDDYGIDEKGNFLSVGIDSSNNPTIFDLQDYETWGGEHFKPRFLTSDKKNWATIKANLGWIEESDLTSLLNWDITKKFAKQIGGGNGRGIVYFNDMLAGMSLTKKVTEGGTEKTKKVLSEMIKSFSSAKEKNNYYQYRILIVQPNGIDAYVNRSIVSDIVKFAETRDKGLVAGVKVECISMYQFANLTKDLTENYDIIYFGSNNGGQAMGKSMYYAAYGEESEIPESDRRWQSDTADTVRSGNDMTVAKKNELNSFIHNGHVVIVSNSLKSALGSKVDKNTNIYEFLNGLTYNDGKNNSTVFEDTESNGQGLNYGVICDTLKRAGNFSLRCDTLPPQYVSEIQTDFLSQNGFAGYHTKNKSISGHSNFINNDSHKNRGLQFDIFVDDNGAKHDYSVDLYVDMNLNGRFENTKEEHKSLSDVKGMSSFSDNVSFLPSDYVGAVTWKIVFTEKGTPSGVTHSVSKTGFSACRAETKKQKQVINILQVYPTDFSSDFGSTTSNRASWGSNPNLLLPTQKEVYDAKIANGGKKISEYSANSNDGITSIASYFSGYLSDVVSTSVNTGEDDMYVFGTSSSVSGEPVPLTYTKNTRAGAILSNSSFCYYFLEKQNDYEIHCTRFSVAEWNAYTRKSGSPTITFDNTEKKIKYPSLVNTAEDGEDPEWETVDTYCDLLMIGFGNNMDYMSQDGISVITDYMAPAAGEGGPTFIGNGVITTSPNNSLATELRNIIGQDRYNVTYYDEHGTIPSNPKDLPYTSGKARSNTDYVAELQGYTRTTKELIQSNGSNPATMMKTNDTTFAHFPYNVPTYMKNTAAQIQQFQLNLEDPDIVVSFAKYSTAGGGSYGNWGDGRDNYYLYKKNNITFCGFGNTYNNKTWDQKGSVMTMPETMLIVNALITSSKFKSGGDQPNPYFDCKDPDHSTTEKTVGDKTEYYDFTYTDYDTSSVVSDADKPVENSSVNTSSNIRKVLYKATVAAGTAVLKASITNGATTSGVPIEIYECDSKGVEKDMESEGNLSDGVTIKTGYYLLYVPLDANDSVYDGLLNLGFKYSTNQNQFDMILTVTQNGTMVEKHYLMLIRRGMFPIS